MAFIEAKAIKVYYTKGDRKPYDINGKPLSYLGQDNIGANIATQVRFYLGEDLAETITPIVVSKRADGERHFDILTEATDTEVSPNQKYYYVNLSNWYSEKVGKLTMALKVYSGTVTIVDGEITTSTGRIVVSDIFHVDIAYAPDASDLVPPFDPDYYEELLEALANKVERQEVIQVVNTLPTVSSADNGKWFLVRQTNGGRLYRVLGGVAVEVETEMGKVKLTPTGNGDVTTNTGRVLWSQPNGTLELGVYNDVVVHLGEDSVYYGKASVAITKGDIIQFAGYQGDHALIKPAVPSEINANSKLIMGIAKQNIILNDFGYVSAFGKIESIDTKGFATGTLIWFDSASGTGQWTNVVPTAPNAKVLVGVVVKAETSTPANNGVILVRPTFEPKLSELQDVLITSATNGNVLRYDGTKWVNSNALTTAESEIDTLQGDVIGLDNTKADITYVDSQDDDLSDRITFIETTGGIDFIKVANFASLPSSGDARNHRLFMTIDTKQLWEWDGSQWNESSPTDLSDIVVTNTSITSTALKVNAIDNTEVAIVDIRKDDVKQVEVDDAGTLIAYQNVVIHGDLDIRGTQTIVNTNSIAIEDNIILINSNQTGTPSGTLKGGIEIERGDSTNYQFIFDESDDRFKIGQVGSLQTVATRQDDVNMVANGIPFYNNTEKRFDTSSVLTWSSATGRVSASQLFASNAIFTPYVASANGQPSSSINFASTGTTISRDINDANHTLIVNNIHATSTGNIANFQWQGTNRLEITRDGFLTKGGNLFLHNSGVGSVGVGDRANRFGGTSVVAVGHLALFNGSATGNTTVGHASLFDATGGGNAALGESAGRTITTGANNTFVGNIAGYNASQLVSATNSTAIGNGSFTDKSNQMVFGNASVSEFKFDRNTSAIVLMPQLQTISANLNIFERTTTDINTSGSILSLKRTSSLDMADGFGPNIAFQIRDNANVDNTIATIRALRSGADNSGRLVFESVNAGVFGEKMTILPNGNVGIGTTAPTRLLSIVAGSNGDGIQIRRNSTTANDFATLGFRISTSESTDNFAEIRAIRTSRVSGLEGDIAFLTTTSGVAPTEKMRIRDDGFVGIGTTAPAGLLHVRGSDLSVFERTTTDTNTTGSPIVLRRTTTGDMADGFGGGVVFQIRDSANVDNNIAVINAIRSGADNSGRLAFFTSTAGSITERMNILANGNVGIGTTAPSTVLELQRSGDVDFGFKNTADTSGNFWKLWQDNYDATPNANFLFKLSYGSTDVITANTNGRVGIGTTTALDEMFSINGTMASLLSIQRSGGTDANSSIRYKMATESWYVGVSSNKEYAIRFNNGDLANSPAFTIETTGLVGINETSPTAQLQVKSGATNRVPLIVDTLASHTANLQEWRVNNVIQMRVDSSFGIYGTALRNISNGSNSAVIVDTTGTTISRNIADANPSLIVNQIHASSTGDIAQFQFGGTTQANIARDGIANFTGTPSNEQTGDYTLVLADKGKVLRVNSSSNRTITIPLNSSVAFPIDTEIALIRYGSGTVSISPTSGVTLNSVSSNRKVKDRYGSCALKKIGTDEWVLVGSLEA